VIAALPCERDAAAADGCPIPDPRLFRKHLCTGDDASPLETLSQETFARHCANIVKTSSIRNEKSVGIYPLPSFINHACAPNSCKLLVGHTVFLRAARDLRKGEEVTIKYFDVASPEPERAARAKRFGIETCACQRCKVERVGHAEAAKWSEEAMKKAKRAREIAVADPANKKPGVDKDGERAASAAVSFFFDAVQITTPAALVAAMRGKAKSSLAEITGAFSEWKRTKGKSQAPDPNALVELATWFDGKCASIGLDDTRSAWARASVVQVYANIAHCLSASGLLEARGEMLEKLAGTIANCDPASFEHCKHLAVSAQNARRLGGADSGKRVAEAEKVAAATLAVRYGCGAGAEDGEIVKELLKNLEFAAVENVGEFCEQ
jgi:hypothetical protein